MQIYVYLTAEVKTNSMDNHPSYLLPVTLTSYNTDV